MNCIGHDVISREWEIIGFAAFLMMESARSDRESRSQRRLRKSAEANRQSGASDAYGYAVRVYGEMLGIKIGLFDLSSGGIGDMIIGGDRCIICDMGGTRYRSCLHDLS